MLRRLRFEVSVMHELQMMGWKLDHIGMTPSAESYLVLHRFGPVRSSLFTLLLTFRFRLPFFRPVCYNHGVYVTLICDVKSQSFQIGNLHCGPGGIVA